MRSLIFPALVALFGSSVAVATPDSGIPGNDELWRIIQQQQAQIEALQRQLSATSEQIVATENQVHLTDQKVEAAGDLIERVADGAGGTPSWADRTSVGGYGEMHYNNLDSKDEIDFHRYVLFFDHDFTESVRFVSELELEHSIAGDDKNGEIELEQAYVEFDLNDRNSLLGGLFLIPVGILNDTHEPPTFFGVERNPVEKNIIPTTWWEGGAAARGRFGDGFSYDAAMHSGLDVNQTGGNAFKIRNGRQKVSEARADEFAYTGRLRWTGMPGIEVGVTSQYQEDVTQGDLEISATLLEAHAVLQRGPFGLRALYARWDLDDSDTIDASDPEAIGRDEQEGWYVEPSLRGQLWQLPGEFGAFFRYNVWDNNAGASNDTEFTQYDYGFNYWPVPDVVVKVDFQTQDNDGAEDDDGWNLGIGYQF